VRRAPRDGVPTRTHGQMAGAAPVAGGGVGARGALPTDTVDAPRDTQRGGKGTRYFFFFFQAARVDRRGGGGEGRTET